jgi:DNA invertase Pin-like site-specific DNA recombinase
MTDRNIAIYARYSARIQKDTSIGRQVRDCKQVIERYGLKGASSKPVLYRDRAQTGHFTKNRKRYLRLIAAIKDEKISHVVTENLDRLSREPFDLMQFYSRAELADVALYTKRGPVDKIKVAVSGVTSTIGFEKRVKRTKRGHRGSIGRGKTAGAKPYGYRKKPLNSTGEPEKGLLEEHPIEARIVREIYKRFIEGEPAEAIAQDLNERGIKGQRGGWWTRKTLLGTYGTGLGILQNPVYCGLQIYNRFSYPKDPVTGRRKRVENDTSEWKKNLNPDLEIISRADWDAVQLRIREEYGPPEERPKDTSEDENGIPPHAKSTIAVYLRSSRNPKETQSVTTQRRVCEKVIEQYGLKDASDEVEFYADVGLSGEFAKTRPDYMRLVEDIKNKRVKCVVTARLDRPSRNPAEIMFFYGIAQLAGIDIYTNRGLTNKRHAAVSALTSVVTKIKQDQRFERGRKANVMAGRSGGGPQNYGFRKIEYIDIRGRLEQGHWEIVPEEAEIVREIYKRYIRGDGVSQITDDLTDRKIPSPNGGKWWPIALIQTTGSKGILENPVYKGLRFRGLMHTLWDLDAMQRKLRPGDPSKIVSGFNKNLIIIPEDEWDAAQIVMKQRRVQPKRLIDERSPPVKVICRYCGVEMLMCYSPHPCMCCRTHNNFPRKSSRYTSDCRQKKWVRLDSVKTMIIEEVRNHTAEIWRQWMGYLQDEARLRAKDAKDIKQREKWIDSAANALESRYRDSRHAASKISEGQEKLKLKGAYLAIDRVRHEARPVLPAQDELNFDRFKDYLMTASDDQILRLIFSVTAANDDNVPRVGNILPDWPHLQSLTAPGPRAIARGDSCPKI